MAILTAYHSVNLNTSSIWNGNVTVADTGHIQITDGIHLQNHYGTFSYGKSGYLNRGNLTSMDYSESALKIYDLSDANYKALTFFVYLSSSKASRLLNYIFAGNDTLNGSPENDVLNGYKGSNTLIGGSGDDRYFVGKGDKVIENPNGGIDTINCISTYTLPDNVENLILLGKSSINGTANILDNTLNGNTGANVLDGGLGADTMIGGNGNDTYIVDNPGDTVIENSSGGKDLVKFNSSIDYIDYTLGANIENLTLTGSAPKSTGTGNELNNIITGNEFANTLDGARGADTLTGGAGDDTYIVDLKTNGQLEDKIKEVAGGGTDTLQLRGHADLSKASTLNLAANLEKLDVSETGNTWLNLKGNALDNILTGNDAANVITGGNGNDTLTGGDGSDLLIGGKGTDTYNLAETKAATDTVRIANGDSLVTGFDIVNGFKLGNAGPTTDGTDKLDLAKTQIAANTSGVDGVDKGVIHSHQIVNGLITFNESPTISSANLVDVFDYLQANITGSNTVAFNSEGNTYVFQDGGANDTLVELTGITANSLSATGLGDGAIWIV